MSVRGAGFDTGLDSLPGVTKGRPTTKELLMKKRLATAAAAFLSLGSAQAQMPSMPPMTMSALYGELGYTFLKIDAFGTSLRPGAIRGILGYDVHPYFAIEGMGAGSAQDDDKSIAIGGIPSNVQTKLEYMYGIWAKPKYTYNQAEFFGRFGWAHTKVEIIRSGALAATRSESQDDFAWGLGVNYRFNPRAYVGIDWMRYSNQSDAHVDGVTLSVGYHW
jgi:opacity protein-like surface antigen